MIVDLHEQRDAALPDVDLCVVGTGPAGMTVVRELAGRGLRIAVLESGRLRPDRHGDALRKVQSVGGGITVKDYSRERVLGGASSTWAGLSSPLDDTELGPRPWLGLEGWPLDRAELEPFWEAAAERYRFARLAAFAPGGFDGLRAEGELQPAWSVLEEKVFLAADDPQHFGKEHRHVFEQAGVDLYLDATLVRLETRPDEGADADDADVRVRRGLVATSDGRRLPIRARIFVLATGGLENARLLLASTDHCPAGLGNEHDLVGRGLMNHPKNYRGILHLARPVREVPYFFGCLHRGFAGYAGLRLPDAELERRGLLNSYVRFEPLFPWSDNRGVESLVLLVKRSKVVFSFWKRRKRGEVVTLRDYSETGDDSDLQNERRTALGWFGLLGNILANAPSVARYVAARLSGQAPLVRRVRLRNFMEMEPRPENRVTLGDERDVLGERVTVVHHDTSERDRRSLLELHEVLAEEFERTGLGRLESDLATATPWPIDLDASHHLGTTAMGRDPARSVTDPDLRLHGVGNVYLAGGSVFPTSGCANPTYTIVALSIRLAQHLASGPLADRAGVQPVAARPAGAAAAADDGRRRVLVVGAGGRVQEDVLPALWALEDRYRVVDVFARSRRPLEVAGRSLETRDARTITQDDLDGADLVYVAVSKGAVPGVLRRLAELDRSATDLLLDTPVLLFKHLGALRHLEGWRRVGVAEDCAWLPWLDTLRLAREDWLGPLRHATFDRSAYRYHGFALLKTLFDGATVRSARRRRVEGGQRLELTLSGGRQGVIVEPRDYARGSFELVGEGGVVTDGDAPEAGAGADAPRSWGAVPAVGGEAPPAGGTRVERLEFVRDAEGGVTGFRIGAHETALDLREQALLGPVPAGARVTAATDALKRVGLLRLLQGLHEGREAWPLEEGLDDMLVDWSLERAGRYLATPLTSLRTRSGRAVLSRALGAVVRT